MKLPRYRSAKNLGAIRQFLKNLRQVYLKRLSPALAVKPLIRHYCSQIDGIVQQQFRQHIKNAHIGLYAVGGYGRRELFPNSDIDLLILVPAPLAEADDSAIKEFIANLWEVGLTVSQSVHSPQSLRDYAKQDLSFLTSLLEARHLAGAGGALDELRPVPVREFFAHKLAEQQRRDRENFGRLEPDLKNGVGSLRDVQMVRWLSLYSGIEPSLTAGEEKKYRESISQLWRLRFMVHLLDPKAKDLLHFGLQQRLAKLLHYEDREDSLAIEQFMRAYYRHSQRIRQCNQLLIKSLKNELYGGGRAVRINQHFFLQNQQLNLKGKLTLPLLFQSFQLLQRNGKIMGLHPDFERLIQRQRDNVLALQRRNNRSNFQGFRQILANYPVFPVLQLMHSYGLLHRLIPDFWHITGQMQYDLFHQYTVDYHSLRLTAYLDGFHEANPLYPEASELWHRLGQRDLLYLAALLHDIGKGRRGDHSEVGAKIAAKYAKRWLNCEEQALLVFLVREHLSLSHTAQKKDISNEQVIEQFAARFPQPHYLDYLYLLTLADISATNGKLWNGWRAHLMHSLYRRTRDFLQRRSGAEDYREMVRHTLSAHLTPENEALWANLPREFFVGAYLTDIVAKSKFLQSGALLAALGPDRFMLASPRPANELFARVCYFLARCNGDIAEARLYRTLDKALNIQEFILNRPLEEADWLEKLTALLQSPEPLKPLRNRLANRQLAFFNPKLQIKFLREHQRTLLDLSCKDRHGLLNMISRLFLQEDIFIHHAKITTLGERAEDVFYLTNRDNQPLDSDQQQRLEQMLGQMLSR